MRTPALVALCQLAFAATCFAQDVNYTFDSPPVEPAAPTADKPTSARLRMLACSEVPIFAERVGFVINLRYVNENCPIIPIPSSVTVDLGNIPAGTYDMRILEVSDPANPRIDDEAIFTLGPAVCEGLCLLNGRFTVTAEWTAHDGRAGSGHPVPLTEATGAFWFFDEENLEVIVKFVGACPYNQHHWFFASGLTDARVVLRVRDERTGAERTYESPRGTAFQPIQDTAAFGCP